MIKTIFFPANQELPFAPIDSHSEDNKSTFGRAVIDLYKMAAKDCNFQSKREHFQLGLCHCNCRLSKVEHNFAGLLFIAIKQELYWRARTVKHNRHFFCVWFNANIQWLRVANIFCLTWLSFPWPEVWIPKLDKA